MDKKERKMKNRLYDATKIDWDNLMFSTKELWMLLIPIMEIGRAHV